MLDKRYGQLCAVYRRAELLQRKRQRAYMVLMPVGQKYPPELFGVFLDIRHIRYNKVDARHIIVRKNQAAVYNYHVLAVFKHSHVLAYFAYAAKGYYLKLVFGLCCFCLLSRILLRPSSTGPAFGGSCCFGFCRIARRFGLYGPLRRLLRLLLFLFCCQIVSSLSCSISIKLYMALWRVMRTLILFRAVF